MLNLIHHVEFLLNLNKSIEFVLSLYWIYIGFHWNLSILVRFNGNVEFVLNAYRISYIILILYWTHNEVDMILWSNEACCSTTMNLCSISLPMLEMRCNCIECHYDCVLFITFAMWSVWRIITHVIFLLTVYRIAFKVVGVYWLSLERSSWYTICIEFVLQYDATVEFIWNLFWTWIKLINLCSNLSNVPCSGAVLSL